MALLLRNPATKQIAVKKTGNVKFDTAITGIDEAVWSERGQMWILPDACLDQVEYFRDKYLPLKASTATTTAEPAKIIPIKAEEQKPEPEPVPTPEPDPEPVSAPETDPSHETPEDPGPDPAEEPKSEPTATSSPLSPAKAKAKIKPDIQEEMKKLETEFPFQSVLLTTPITPWREKLGALYRKAKAENNSEFMELLKVLGNMTKEDPKLQEAIEQPQKTFDRAYKYVTDKVMETYLSKEQRKGQQCVAVPGHKVLTFVMEYIAEDDYQKIVDEEKAEFYRKIKADKDKAARQEKEKKRKEKEAKKKAKEEAEKQKKEATAPVPEEIPAPKPEEKPADPESETVPVPEPAPVAPDKEPVPATSESTDLVEKDDVYDDQLSLL